MNWLLRWLGVRAPAQGADVYLVYVRDAEADIPLLGRALFGSGYRVIGARRCALELDALTTALHDLVELGHPYDLSNIRWDYERIERKWEWDPTTDVMGGPWGRAIRQGYVRYLISRTPRAVEVHVKADEALRWDAARGEAPDGSEDVDRHGGVPRVFPPDVPTVAIAEYIVSDTEDHEKVNFRVLPPWIVSPGSEPHDGGWRQGSGEAWMHRLWRPFWEQLSAEERNAYLERWPPPSDSWAYYLTHLWQ